MVNPITPLALPFCLFNCWLCKNNGNEDKTPTFPEEANRLRFNTGPSGLPANSMLTRVNGIPKKLPTDVFGFPSSDVSSIPKTLGIDKDKPLLRAVGNSPLIFKLK